MNESTHSGTDLLGYHLGLLDADEAAAVAQLLEQSDATCRQREELAAALQPLDAFTVPEAGPELAARLLDRVATLPRLRVHESLPPRKLLSGDAAPMNDGPMISLKELIGLAAAVALFVALFVPGYRHARNTAMQTACLDNFRALGAANANYAQASGGVLPFAGEPPMPWLATQSGAPKFGNSHNVFLLLPLGFVDPSRFICRARPNDRPMPADQIQGRRDFASIHNNSYSTQLLASPMRPETLDPATPVGGDQNPRFEEGMFHPRSLSNSDSHGAALGQNVLRIDGAAAWSDRAEVGPGGDDIFKLANLSNYTGYERPQSNTDAFLVP